MIKKTIVSIALVAIALWGFNCALAEHPPAAVQFGGDIIQSPIDGSVIEIDGNSRDLGLEGACDRIVEGMCIAECAGKGIRWDLTVPCPAPSSVPGNTLGPGGMGLLYGYTVTGDASHLIGALDLGEYASCYTYSTSEYRFATGTPHFLWFISDIFPHSPSYREHAQVEYFAALDNGTYGPAPYTTTTYLQAIATARSGIYINLRPYEMSDMLRSSYLIGASLAQFDEIACWAMQDAIDQLDNDEWWSVLAPACGVFGLSMAGLDYDPQAGAWASTSSMMELMDALLAYQVPPAMGEITGGFVYSALLTPPLNPDDQSLQATAYALLAMKALDPWRYADEITAAENWIWDMQLPNGGFLTYTGGSENIQINGEALWALLFEADPIKDGDVDGNKIHTPQDSQQAFMIALQSMTPTWREFNSADCDGNGSITAEDALCIWKHFLALGCDCVDEIILPPTCSKKLTLSKPVHQISNGQLVATVKNNGETAMITIDTERTKIDIDSFGFYITVPNSWILTDRVFSKDIQVWNNFDAVQNNNTVVVGGWDLTSNISNSRIATLTFDVKPGLSNQGIRLSNLVDDIADFSVIVR